MNQMPFSRSAVANAFIRESSDLRNHTDKLLAGVAIVAVSLLAACQSPLAISPVAADTGSIETISSSAAASAANETLASESVRMAPYAGARSDTENIMDEEFELVVTVDDSAAIEMYLLQRSDSENIMDEAFELAYPSDAEYVITPDGWFVAPEQGYQFGFQE